MQKKTLYFWQLLKSALLSMSIMISCLFGVIILIFLGTIEQASTGIFVAQEKFFRCWFVYWGSSSIPVFPGGYFFSTLLLISLVFTLLFRFSYSKKTIGILFIHIGLIFLIIGEIITGLIAEESQMVLRKGISQNYSESLRDVELVFSDLSQKEYDQIVSFPQKLIKINKSYLVPHTNLKLIVKEAYPNAELKQVDPIKKISKPSNKTQINRGIGKSILVAPLPEVKKDNESNVFTAFIELQDKNNRSFGSWLVSNAIPNPQLFKINNKVYSLQIRKKRSYFPFTFQLFEFIHEIYPGTNIPKEFCSKINLYNEKTEFDRSVSISMNQPLYYNKKTFYQASFGENDSLSILHVVKNPTKQIPYYSSAIIGVGLLIQFFSSFSIFARHRKQK